MLATWIWNFDPTLFEVFGKEVRWYGLLFMLGFIIGNFVMRYMYRRQSLDPNILDPLLLYIIIGVIIGARLGHVLFYDPAYYFSNPIKILAFREGGLASHGGTIGAFIATFIYCRRYKQPLLWVVDHLVIVCAIGASLIRLGNFTNSEIYGYSTQASTGIVFAHDALNYIEKSVEAQSATLSKYSEDESTDLLPLQMHLTYAQSIPEERLKAFLQKKLPSVFKKSYIKKHLQTPGDTLDIEIRTKRRETLAQVTLWGVARHPTQLYESFFYMILAVGLFLCWRFFREKYATGTLFAASVVFLWTFRFFIEFLKEKQAHFDPPLGLHMGQILSIPFVIIGIILWIYVNKVRKKQLNITFYKYTLWI